MVKVTLLPLLSSVLIHSHVNSALENLPAELRIQTLLELQDLASLHSLVLASPSYHASYSAIGRWKVLSRLALQKLDYCLFVATQLPQAKQLTNLSEREHIRLYRSLYRYQAWCNFLGPESFFRTRLIKFLPTFPPGEIQEMVCVWQYLMKLWRAVFQEVSGLA